MENLSTKIDMGKKLAIKGHLTRGKEVIEILKMLGGNDDGSWWGNDMGSAYFINDCTEKIDVCKVETDIVVFTLEEFLEKYPYKVGDKVYTKSNAEGTIIDMFWDGIEVLYQLSSESVNALGYFHTNELKAYKETNMDESKFGTAITILASKSNSVKLVERKCERTHEDAIFDSIIWHLRNSVNNGKQNLSGGECEDYFREVVKKNNENKMKSVLAELIEHIKTTPKEELEREFEEIKEWSNVGPTVEEFMTFCESVNKKPFYPKTYDECCKVLDFCGDYFLTTYDEDCIINKKEVYDILQQTNSLTRLLICKSAYWKIAGEEMGLGKSWEPYEEDELFIICNNRISGVYKSHGICTDNFILSFPTEEMRDAFYENFRDLIESCKELL